MTADVAFNISGGLHHAMPGYAYGFCVFNDPVIAIKYLVSQGMKVAYVDIDCRPKCSILCRYAPNIN